MLINSNTIKGTCPICGAAGCNCGGPSKSVPVDENVVMATEGPLKKYHLGRGTYVQLTEDEARRRGLLNEHDDISEKMDQAAPNKMRAPGTAHNKGRG
jgi:hypothetical protein